MKINEWVLLGLGVWCLAIASVLIGVLIVHLR